MAERCRRNCAGRAPLPTAEPSTSPSERGIFRGIVVGGSEGQSEMGLG